MPTYRVFPEVRPPVIPRAVVVRGRYLGDATADESQLAAELHDLATSIALAKRAGDKAAVAGLYTQFQAVAAEYQRTGNNLATLNLINAVSDSVQRFLSAAAEAPGIAVGDVLGGLFKGLGLWTVVIVGGLVVWFAWPVLLRRRRAA